MISGCSYVAFDGQLLQQVILARYVLVGGVEGIMPTIVSTLQKSIHATRELVFSVTIFILLVKRVGQAS